MTTADGEEVVVGIGGSSHDFSCALMVGRDIRVAIEEERLSRVKHGMCWWYDNPVRRSMEYCLREARLSLEQVDLIVSSDLTPFRVRASYPQHQYLAYPHHACHAASATVMVPPDEKTAVIVFDGMGSLKEVVGADPWLRRETFSFFLSHGGRLQPLGQTTGAGYLEQSDFPTGVRNSVGLLYEVITAEIGFQIDDAGKTMGLAGYGVPRFAKRLEEFMSWGASRDDCFRFDPYDSAFLGTVTSILQEEHASFKVRADLAASVQALFERTLLHCYRLIEGEQFSVLCLAGGCALNAAANTALADALPEGRRLLVPSHVSDAGLAFGALALYAARSAENRLTFRGQELMPHIMRPGKLYDDAAIRQALLKAYPRVIVQPLHAPAQELAQRLAAGQVIAVFAGASEFGPRALGGRSILADPRDVATRERINRKIKGREPFRPLAPMVRESAYDEYFEPATAKSYFMTVISRATEVCVVRAPAVVHVDGTARAQIVTRHSDTFLSEVIDAFEALTGLPMLLNTSFNRRGEPIVESPDDAVDAFLAMSLDGLLLGNIFVLRAE